MSVIFINPYRFGVAYDADAQAYFDRVEGVNGDNQPLETAVKDAINAFVVGCKADGIWNAIKASCILAGARTLSGALVPLVGTAPTNISFVSGDYNRKTGLTGQKSLNSNRANNADPTNNNHNAIYMPSRTTTTNTQFNFVSSGFVSGWNNIQVFSDNICYVYSRETSDTNAGPYSTTLPFLGTSRSSSASFTYRVRGTTVTSNASSQTANANTISISSAPNARLAFYSIGESLDLALLDARVTTLINAFAAAIP